jgi:pilus assembly protein CpaE
VSRFLLVTTDTDFAGRVTQAISGGLTGTLHVFTTAELPETPAEMLTPSGAGPANAERTEVVILGPGVVIDDALTLAAVFDVQLPEISLVLVAQSDPEVALSAMRSGVRDILNPESDSETIRVLLERACRTAANRRRVTQTAAGGGAGAPSGTMCNVIVVASPKGGVGKTTLATNLAVALGKLAPMATVLVDLDAQFGDVASALQLEPEHTLTDAVSRAASQDSMVLKAYLSVHHSSIYALCAPHTPAEADRISGDDIAHLLTQLANEFRYVVVDSAPGLGEHTLAALENATDVLLMCTMDVPSVRGLRKEMDVLDKLKLVPRNRHIVVNFSERTAGLSIRDIEATIGANVDVAVPRSRQVAQSTDAGEPLLQRTSRGRPAKTLQTIANFYDPSATPPTRKGQHKRVEVQ